VHKLLGVEPPAQAGAVQ